MKKNPSILKIIFIIPLILLAGFSVAFANVKVEMLHQKIADIKLLQQQLKDRWQQAETIRNALKQQQDALNAEIKVLIKSMRIKTFQQSRNHLRIYYNIELLRIIVSYLNEFDSKIRFYQNGQDKLNYLHQIVEDDIRMISTLSDLKIDALTTQISLVINQYLPEAHIIQIDPECTSSISSQEIWDEIVKDVH